MFLLKDLPARSTLERFASHYPVMDVETTQGCLRLLRVASLLLMDMENHFNQHGLSQARFLALVILEREPAGTFLMPVQIAEKMGVSKKNTTRLLAFMEDDVLIIRMPHPSDKRAYTIGITEKGKAVLEAVMPGYYAVMNTAMAALNGVEKASLNALLGTLDAALHAAAGGEHDPDALP